MKEDEIKEFFNHHKQSVKDEGFSERVFLALDYLPKPAERRRVSYTRNNWMISVLCGVAGFILFALFGGYSEIVNGLSSFGEAVFNRELLTPEIVVSIVLVGCSLFAVGKFAIEVE